jgi:hypothetical protein
MRRRRRSSEMELEDAEGFEKIHKISPEVEVDDGNPEVPP